MEAVLHGSNQLPGEQIPACHGACWRWVLTKATGRVHWDIASPVKYHRAKVSKCPVAS